jgi:hypothetical protein
MNQARIIDGNGSSEWMDLDAARARAEHGQIIDCKVVCEIDGRKVEFDEVVGVDQESELRDVAGDISDLLRWLKQASSRALPSRDEAARILRQLLEEISEHVS